MYSQYHTHKSSMLMLALEIDSWNKLVISLLLTFLLFYFGNRVLRAPDYKTAHRFAEKLAIRNLNSNKVYVLNDKKNERWFIAPNDKIYFSQNSYNQDPNKNVYVDPIDVGMVFI